MLLQNNQKTIILEHVKGKLTLNSGIITKTSEISRFKTCLLSKISIKFLDGLFDNDLNIKQEASIKRNSAVATAGGKAAIASLKKSGKTLGVSAGNIPWNKNKKGVQKGWNKGLTKETSESVMKISKSKLGENNPMYGKKHTKESKLKQSATMKKLILSGEYLPNSNNRNTSWNSLYENVNYRSSWECLYKYYNPDAEYETLRIKYLHNGSWHIYIVDFIDHVNKIVCEVKPSNLFKEQKTIDKMKYLNQWAIENNYKVIKADEKYLSKYPYPKNIKLFNEDTKNKLDKFYETYK